MQATNGAGGPQSSTLQWEQQYCLRLLPGSTDSGSTAAQQRFSGAGSDSGGAALQNGSSTASQDIPSFLEGCKDAILVTGEEFDFQIP